MNAVICVTNTDRVTHTNSAVTGGNEYSTAGIAFCHTHGGACSNRSLHLRTGGVRANSRRRARCCAWTAEPSAVTGSEVSR